jgi:hypothetical protein
MQKGATHSKMVTLKRAGSDLKLATYSKASRSTVEERGLQAGLMGRSDFCNVIGRSKNDGGGCLRDESQGTAAYLSLQAIKGTRLAQMRQLFRSCVLLITDYAASAWYGLGKPGVIRLAHVLEKVQRAGVRMILRAWKVVSLPILKAEAYLESTKQRLDRKVITQMVKLISLPRSNPVRRVLPYALNIYRYISPLSTVYAVAKERLKLRGSRLPLENPLWIQLP